MRRVGGWILVGVAVAAMAGGGWVALKPLLRRETLVVGFFRADAGRDPSNDALYSGAAFALEEAGGKAGGFHVVLVEPKPTDAPLPGVWIGTSEALQQHGDHQPRPFLVSLLETLPRPVAGQLQILPGCAEVGRAAAAWSVSSGARRIFLLRERGSARSTRIAEAFEAAGKVAAQESLEATLGATGRRELVTRIMAAAPDLVFYSGEDAPYGTSEALFTELRTRGYAGTLIMADGDPEVSFLAVPSRVPDGTLLLSPIGPPSASFAARYEPATKRHAGPHGWIGYLGMKAALEVIDRTGSTQIKDLRSTAARLPADAAPCALYVARDGKFVFLQNLK
jgi:hypothetical protein